MEQKHDPDGIGTVAQLAALQQNDETALNELEVCSLYLCLRQINFRQAATKLCQSALQASANSYEQLLAQYTALKETVHSSAKDCDRTKELDDAQKYVLVLIDAHSHTVCYYEFVC